MSFLKRLFSSGESKIESYEDFWNWFSQHEREFHQIVKHQGNIPGYFFGKVAPRLTDLRDGYHLLTGMVDEHTVELLFSANGDLKNMVFMDEVVAAAPNIEGWRFRALRPQMDVGSKGIKLGDYEFTKEKIGFYVADDPAFPDEINIVLIHDDFEEENANIIINGTFVFLDHLLGELDFATLIDSVEVKGTADAEKELVPIEKIMDFLKWREKEFVEKYEGTRKETDQNEHAIIKAELEDGSPLMATVNTELLAWDGKASHPWMLLVEITYDGDPESGLPDDATGELLNEIEDKLMLKLKDVDGYLNIARESAQHTRKIYFACKEFKKSSKEVDLICREYADIIPIEYDIYKDKYWRSLEQFQKL